MVESVGTVNSRAPGHIRHSTSNIEYMPELSQLII